MIVLGLSGALNHDPSAALVIDGETVAAAEEERFVREKHAKGRPPYEAARFCLAFAGVDPKHVDRVAFPYAPISITSPARWHYARRYWYAPDRALDALINGNRRFRAHRRNMMAMGERLGIDWGTRFAPSSITGACLQRVSPQRLPGKRHPGCRRQGRVRDHVLRLRRGRRIHRLKNFTTRTR